MPDIKIDIKEKYTTRTLADQLKKMYKCSEVECSWSREALDGVVNWNSGKPMVHKGSEWSVEFSVMWGVELRDNKPFVAVLKYYYQDGEQKSYKLGESRPEPIQQWEEVFMENFQMDIAELNE